MFNFPSEWWRMVICEVKLKRRSEGVNITALTRKSQKSEILKI